MKRDDVARQVALNVLDYVDRGAEHVVHDNTHHVVRGAVWLKGWRAVEFVCDSVAIADRLNP